MSDAFPMVVTCTLRQALWGLHNRCTCGEPITHGYVLCPPCALKAELKYGRDWRARYGSE